MRLKTIVLRASGYIFLLSAAVQSNAGDATTSDTHSRVYDGYDRLITEVDANNSPTDYAYDPDGNLIQITDALGIKTQMRYDALNRLTTIPSPGPWAGVP